MKKVYFILGCTACGKASAGRVLAKKLGAQILSVDSMKVYRRMNIGTAKPPESVLADIPHFGVNLVEPSEHFSVAEYIEHAKFAIDQAEKSGKILLAVGGTSLYIQAMTKGLFDAPKPDPEIRKALQIEIREKTPQVMHRELAAVDPVSAERIHPNDEMRIVRALEVFRSTGKTISEMQTQWDSAQPVCEPVLIGLRREKEIQSRRINSRVKKMVEMGLVEEVRALLDEEKPLSKPAAQAVGYAELIEHFEGKVPLEKAIENIKVNTRRLAKKQRTWYRRWANVNWFDLEENETPEETADRIIEQIKFE